MVSLTRLPPAPVDSALARFVARIVPGASVARVRALNAKMRQMAAQFDSDMQAARAHNQALRRDLQALAHPCAHISEVTYKHFVNEASLDRMHRVTAAFQPVTWQVQQCPDRGRVREISAVTLAALQEAAHRVASSLADQHADAILQITLARAGFNKEGNPLK